MSPGTKILLTVPDYRASDVFPEVSFPVGLGYLAESLAQAGIGYAVVDLNVEPAAALFAALNAHRPKFLGIGMMSYRCLETYALLAEVKRRYPGVTIVAGGPHLTTNREQVLAECPAIDYGFIGESERTLAAFLGGRPLVGISGVLYRDRDRILSTGDREFITDLDALPFPTYVGFKVGAYSRTVPIHSSRGCPYQCIFCGGPLILGRKWRARSAARMIEEVAWWHDRGYRAFVFSDSNFGLDRRRVGEFCDLVAARGLDVSLAAEGVRGDHFDREMLARMRRAGFGSLAIGVESGSDAILKNLKKGATAKQLEETVAAAVDLGFEVTLFFIVGSPGEGAAEIRQSFALALRHDVARAYFFTMTPIPGTEFHRQAVEAGYIADVRGRYPEGNFGFSDSALLPTGVLTARQLGPWIRRARRVERRIEVRHLLAGKLGGGCSPARMAVIDALAALLSPKPVHALFRRTLAVRAHLPWRTPRRRGARP